ncbi:hypothetical protein BY458DRAFT_482150 [Sporodiniella umbellata]|nr:hypothetical protein BY458DRAFT_482150 [Sporodiniella umbellata]
MSTTQMVISSRSIFGLCIPPFPSLLFLFFFYACTKVELPIRVGQSVFTKSIER